MPFLSVFNYTSSAEKVKTRLGISAPLGSVLSYQLSLTEGYFRVVENMNCEKLQIFRGDAHKI